MENSFETEQECITYLQSKTRKYNNVICFKSFNKNDRNRRAPITATIFWVDSEDVIHIKQNFKV